MVKRMGAPHLQAVQLECCIHNSIIVWYLTITKEE